MASNILYPPMVQSYLPAITNNKSMYIYFSLAKFSQISVDKIKGLHISIVKQDTGQNVVNTIDTNRFRSTGIILCNFNEAIKVDNNYYAIVINTDDVRSGDKTGWQAGWNYKVQLRLSEKSYSKNYNNQSDWLNENSNYFSEWSTYCVFKVIGEPTITLPLFGYTNNFKSDINTTKEYDLISSTLDIKGFYSNEEVSEVLKSYRLKLFSDDILIEDSNIIYTNKIAGINNISYVFKYELEDSKKYKLNLEYQTINNYTNTIDIPIVTNITQISNTTFSLKTIDNDYNLLSEYTSIAEENEEGRIGIKIVSNTNTNQNVNLCIRRCSDKDDFSTWEDIKIIQLKSQKVSDLPLIYDNTIENGVFYKYGIQKIEFNGDRTNIVSIVKPIKRDFEYSYLIGKNGKQLTLKYNNDMQSLQSNYAESKVDTIGSKYPFITRNGSIEYKSFPLNGLISFNMDENHLFMSDCYDIDNFLNEDKHLFVKNNSLYYNNNVEKLYKDNKEDYLYDFKHEFDFREKVLEFLQDGEPKLFKSATEGNIIVRLMQVACQPNQSLSRLIYSFTSNAFEIDEHNLENLDKYNIINIGQYQDISEFKQYRKSLSQLDIEIGFNEDIISKIYEKYDKSDFNIGNEKITISELSNLSIEIADKPQKVKNNAGYEVMGFNLEYNGKLITMNNFYKFDSLITFDSTDTLKLLKPQDLYIKDGVEKKTFNILVDFVREEIYEPFIKKEVESRSSIKKIGQYISCCESNDNLFNMIYYKHFVELPSWGQTVTDLRWTCIEADVGSVFEITDIYDLSQNNSEKSSQYHIINETGILNLETDGRLKNLKYIGKYLNYKNYDDIELIPIEDKDITPDMDIVEKTIFDENGNTETIKYLQKNVQKQQVYVVDTNAKSNVIVNYNCDIIKVHYKE